MDVIEHYWNLVSFGEMADGIVENITENKWTVLGVGVAGCTLLWLYSRPRNLPPGPRGYYILGSSGGLSADMHLDCVRLGKKYGDIFSFNVPGTGLAVILNSHEMIKEALVARGEDFAYRPPSNVHHSLGMQDELLYAPYNTEWKENRKFTVANLRKYSFGSAAGEKKMLDQVNAMMENLRERQSEEVELSDILNPVAMNIFCSIVYDEHMDINDPRLIRFCKDNSRRVDLFCDSNFLMLDFFPKWTHHTLFRYKWKPVKSATDIVLDRLKETVEHHLKSFDADNPRDVIDGYIVERGTNIDSGKLAALLLTLIVDPTHTLPTIVESMFFFVCKYPEFQREVQEQIDEAVGKSRSVSIKDRSQLPLVEALFIETTRITNPVPMTPPRIAKQDLAFAGYNIPKGALIFANFYAVHFNESIYPESDKFKPHRFIDQQGRLHKTDAWYCFGAGRRMCVGDQLAKTEIFLLAANLLQRFTFSFPEDYVPHGDAEVRETDVFNWPLPYKTIVKER